MTSAIFLSFTRQLKEQSEPISAPTVIIAFILFSEWKLNDCLISKSGRMGKACNSFPHCRQNKRIGTNGPQVLQITKKSHIHNLKNYNYREHGYFPDYWQLLIDQAKITLLKCSN